MSNILHDALAQFRGMTPDQIAEMCRKRGVKARRKTTSRCPIAIILHDTAVGHFAIGASFVVRQPAGQGADGNAIEKVRTPSNVMQFIRAFDRGDYPDLVAQKYVPVRIYGKKRTRRRDQRRGKNRHNLKKLADRLGNGASS